MYDFDDYNPYKESSFSSSSTCLANISKIDTIIPMVSPASVKKFPHKIGSQCVSFNIAPIKTNKAPIP